jgi:hypothetical protein
MRFALRGGLEITSITAHPMRMAMSAQVSAFAANYIALAFDRLKSCRIWTARGAARRSI